MNRYIVPFILLLVIIAKQLDSQTDPRLAGADKLYIKMLYNNAAVEYEFTGDYSSCLIFY